MNAETIHTEALQTAQFIAGDRSAFDAIYYRYYEAVYNNANSILKDTAAAEDIVQEVFLALWQKRNSLQHPENIAGWLFVTASNKSLNLLRKRLRERLAQQAPGALEQIPFIPEDTEIEQKQLKLLRESIEALPTQRKKVFELCKLEGKSYEETAKLLHISKNTVKTQMSRALDSIKEYISTHPGDPLVIAWLLSLIGRL